MWMGRVQGTREGQLRGPAEMNERCTGIFAGEGSGWGRGVGHSRGHVVYILGIQMRVKHHFFWEQPLFLEMD
jgi:hypothetical protein